MSLPRTQLITLTVLGLLLGTSCSDTGDAVIGDGSSGDVIVVSNSGSGDFTTVQGAVDAADPGDVVQVRPGFYAERVVVDKDLLIVGEAGSSLSAEGVPPLGGSSPGDSAVLVIRNTSDVVVEGMTFTGPEDGVIVRNSLNIELRDINASGNGSNGVDIRASVGVRVTGTFDDNGDHGVRVREGSDDVIVESSEMTGNADDGIRVRDSNAVTVRANNSSGNGDHGIEVRDSSAVALVENTANDNSGFGIRIRESDVLLKNNTTSGNREGDFFEE